MLKVDLFNHCNIFQVIASMYPLLILAFLSHLIWC